MRRLLLIIGWSCGFLGFSQAASPVPEKDLPLIQIGVEVVEVDEQKALDLGFDWVNTLKIQEAAVPALLTLGTLTRDQVFADIHALEQNGAADLLASPKLVTRDGTTANFHAGGELPYAVSSGLGTATVLFKPYGINLKINPHLGAHDMISMALEAEVSGPDSQNVVALAGNVVPGIRSRTVSSELTMAAGNTLTMAGLIQHEKQTVRQGIPGLVNVPILKYLFSRKIEKDDRKSIIVFVTPTLIRDMANPSDGATLQKKPLPLLPVPTTVVSHSDVLPLPATQAPANPGRALEKLEKDLRKQSIKEGTALDDPEHLFGDIHG